MPNKYPDLSAARVIAVDIETKDPNLLDMGPGVYRGDGAVMGVSISTGDGFHEYFNIGHEGVAAQEQTNNINYLKNVLALPVPKVGANLLYDLDWLENGLGLPVAGPIHDVQIAEPLLDEYRRSYALDALADAYLGKRKEKGEIERYAAARGWKGDPRAHIWRMPAEVVRAYAIADADLPIEIFRRQYPRLKRAGLLDVYALEMDLYPVLLRMRRAGVRIDRSRVASGIEVLTGRIKGAEGRLAAEYGPFQVNSSLQLSRIFDRLGVAYPRHAPTARASAQLEMGAAPPLGNPKLDADELRGIAHPIAAAVLDVREARTCLSNFFVNAFSKMTGPDGRIHCSFNPLRDGTRGTVTGRLSASNPNLQQIPGKGKGPLGEMCRAVFIPEDGMAWGKFDWSQVEYRLIAHYATGPGAEEIRRAYREKPETDYHAWVQSVTGLDRTTAKRLNFGMAYFMGINSCAKKFGWTLEEAERFVQVYHEAVPFIKTSRAAVVYRAKKDGEVRSILGRRARMTDEIKKAGHEHAFFNRLIQGSAADLMKSAMVQAERAGVFDVLVPHLTVHDELDFSVPRTAEGGAAFMELKKIMETCVTLKVPLVAEGKIGTDWATLKTASTAEEVHACLAG